MRKPGFHICENKGTDQLRGNLCFCYKDSTIHIYLKFQAYSHLLWLRSPVGIRPSLKPKRPVFLTMRLIARYVSDLVGNPKDRFSHNEAHIRTFLLRM